MSSVNIQEKLTLSDILKDFYKGCKQKENFKIGLEYERLPLKNESFNMVDYYENNGLCNFLRKFAEDNAWDYIVDEYSLIGLKKGHDTITLEPGCQMEFSLKPEEHIKDIKTKVTLLNNMMSETLDNYGFSLYEYGISPITTYKNRNLLPKRRYGIMANYPIRCGVDSGYKSFRALAWLNTDSDRCGFATIFNKDFGFEDYIKSVMNVPMIFISRKKDNIKINGRLKFKDFMTTGYDGYEASLEDFKLHANLYFPEVRLREFIEIRNHDCVNKNMLYSLLAFYKGIFNSEEALTAVENLIDEYTYQDISELRYNIPKLALQADIKGKQVKDIARELMRIAYISLDNAQNNEEIYLEPILEFIEDGVSPADVILLNWYGLWNKDINKLMKYIKTA